PTAGEQQTHRRRYALFMTFRSNDVQFLPARCRDFCFPDQEGHAREMVAMQVGQHDHIDRLRINVKSLETTQGRRAAVNQDPNTRIDQKACLESAASAEGIATASNLERDTLFMPVFLRRHVEGSSGVHIDEVECISYNRAAERNRQ